MAYGSDLDREGIEECLERVSVLLGLMDSVLVLIDGFSEEEKVQL